MQLLLRERCGPEDFGEPRALVAGLKRRVGDRDSGGGSSESCDETRVGATITTMYEYAPGGALREVGLSKH